MSKDNLPLEKVQKIMAEQTKTIKELEEKLLTMPPEEAQKIRDEIAYNCGFLLRTKAPTDLPFN